MTPNINPLQGPQGPRPTKPSAAPKPEGAEGSPSFKDVLEQSIEQVNEMQVHADKIFERFVSGDPDVKHEDVMVAMRKAQVAFETLMQIRNKLVDAYENIQQMRI